MSATIAAGASNPKAVVLTNEQVNKLSVYAISFCCHDASLGRDNVALFTFDALLAAANLLLDIAQYQTGAIKIWESFSNTWRCFALICRPATFSNAACMEHPGAGGPAESPQQIRIFSARPLHVLRIRILQLVKRLPAHRKDEFG